MHTEGVFFDRKAAAYPLSIIKKKRNPTSAWRPVLLRSTVNNDMQRCLRRSKEKHARVALKERQALQNRTSVCRWYRASGGNIGCPCSWHRLNSGRGSGKLKRCNGGFPQVRNREPEAGTLGDHSFSSDPASKSEDIISLFLGKLGFLGQ